MKNRLRTWVKTITVALFLIVNSQGALAGGGQSHHVAGFLGGTTASKNTAFTIGADYEYRLSMADSLFGVGALIDYALFSNGVLVTGIPVFIHPLESLKFAIAPILEFSAGHSAFGFRGGVGYGFHLGEVSIEPTLNMDYANKHIAWVYGFNIGTGF